VLGVMAAVGLASKMTDVAFMTVSVVVESVVASMLLTRVRVKPGAFSAGLIVVLFATLLVGGVVGLGGSLILGLVEGSTLLSVVLQWSAVILLAGAVAYIGSLGLDRLAKGFQFS